MMRRLGAIGAVLLLAGCNGAPDNGTLAQAEARGAKTAAADGRIECALEGAKLFDRTCTVTEMSGADGAILVVGKQDVGYRRLQITTDGRGVVSADGAEPAKVAIVGDGMIEVTVGGDRYRLPANTSGAP
jgi:cytochrome c5